VHPFRVIEIEVIVPVVVFVIIVKNCFDTSILSIIKAIQGDEVADNKFSHDPAPQIS
jgi:hypothetical protein